MEWKIGEIRQVDGEWYQCVESDNCGKCSLSTTECGSGTKSDLAIEVFGNCSKLRRSDNKHVIFKKLEKVGASYMLKDKKFQKYKVFKTPYIYHKIDCSWQSFADPYYISLEIKQNKEEDMKESKVKLSQEEYDYIRKKIKLVILPGNLADDVDSDELGSEIMKLFSIDEKLSNPENENLGKNLKPFNLEEAKAGKPVCTRNGQKARIICFDRNDLYPIVALIECEDGKEIIGAYSKEGQTEIYEIKGTDLMMLSEKKEGWVNVDKRSNGDVIISKPYPTRDEAIHNSSELTIDTVILSWNE